MAVEGVAGNGQLRSPGAISAPPPCCLAEQRQADPLRLNAHVAALTGVARRGLAETVDQTNFFYLTSGPSFANKVQTIQVKRKWPPGPMNSLDHLLRAVYPTKR